MYSEMEHTPMLKGENDTSHRNWLVAIFITLLITMVFSIVAMAFAIQAADLELKSESNGMPRKYLLPSEYVLPPTNQSNIGSCWSFASIYILEAQYRAQGIKKGYLNPDEYVELSEQAYFTFLGEHCQAHPETKPCHYGGLMKGSSEDQQIESLYYFLKEFPDLKKSIVPFEVCPYRSKPDDWQETGWSYFWCPDLEKAVEKNPISFTVKSHETAYSLQGAKELLLKKKRALGIGSPLPNMRYWVPCNTAPFNTSETCVNQVYNCPADYRDEFCIPIDIDGRQRDGVFLSHVDPKFVSVMGGHAMNIVGYNDDWILRSRYMSNDRNGRLTGGLILHNSWRGEGHSVEYLMDERSYENEATLCPNHRISVNWIPLTLECIQENPTDYKKCSTDFKRIRGNGTTMYADALKLKGQTAEILALGLDPDSTYFIRRAVKKTAEDFSPTQDAMVEDLPGGLQRIHFIELTKESEVIDRFIDNFPYWYLTQIFEPIDVVDNDPYQCGYWILPYNTIEVMRSINWDFMDNFRAFDLEVEFDDSSYARAPAAKGKDLSYLEASTHRFSKTEFDGPLPFDRVF